MAKKNYVIICGHKRPEKMITGFLDKRSGTPTGDVSDVGVPVGVHLILNYSEVWGKRVVEGSKSNEIVSVTDKDYRGKIEFLEWGHKDGYRLQLRYLSASPGSLDLQYQKQILKLEPTDDDATVALAQGENRFDYDTEGLLIQFLKNHFRNEDNKNRNPNVNGHDFIEMTEDKEDKTLSKIIEAKGNAVQMITSFSSKPESLRHIAEVVTSHDASWIFGLDETSTDLEVYTTLLKYADSNSAVMLSIVDTFKKKVANEFNMVKAHNKLDLTKDKVIALIDGAGKKQALLENIPAKGDAMIQYAVDKIFTAEVYAAYKIIATEASKL